MNRKFWMIFIVFFINFIFHFGYDIFPNFITSIFFPVNESIWEHQKLIYTSSFVGIILERLIFKEKGNFCFNLLVSGFINIITFLILYLPFRSWFGEIMIVTFIILFLSIIITQIITYYLSLKKDMLPKSLCIILIIITYIGFTYFSYYPLTNFLFYDTKDMKYGI